MSVVEHLIATERLKLCAYAPDAPAHDVVVEHLIATERLKLIAVYEFQFSGHSVVEHLIATERLKHEANTKMMVPMFVW